MQRILFFLFLFGFQFSYAQVFETVLADVDDMQLSTDMIEVDDGYIVSVLERNTYWRLKIIKINKAGIEVARVQYPERVIAAEASLTVLSDTSFLLNYLSRSEGDSVRCIYRVLNNHLEEIIYREVDPEISFTGALYCFSRTSLMSSGNIVHSFNFYSLSDNGEFPFYLVKTDMQLTEASIKMHTFPKKGTALVQLGSAISYMESDTLLLLFNWEIACKVAPDLSIADTISRSFYIFQGQNVTYITWAPSSQWLSDGSLIAGGGVARTIAVAKYNPDLSKNNFVSIDPNVTDIQSPYFEPLSVYNDQIFIGCTMDWLFGINPYFGHIKDAYPRLYKLNADLEIIWEMDYHKDNGYHYYIQNILATSDGGCLLASTRSNLSTQGERVDLYLMKVNGNGQLGIQEEPVQSEVKVYPNPGRTEFTVSVEHFTPGSIFSLYDLSGRCVMHQRLSETAEIIDVSFLPSGVYIYEVYNKESIQGRGKWIKVE